jgi:hypothetical protein
MPSIDMASATSWNKDMMAAGLRSMFGVSMEDSYEIVRRVLELQEEISKVLFHRMDEAMLVDKLGKREVKLESTAQAINCTLWLNNQLDQDPNSMAAIGHLITTVVKEYEGRRGSMVKD